MTDRSPLRVAILWRELAGYTAACFNALAAEDVDIHLVFRDASEAVPYTDASLNANFPGHRWKISPDQQRIRADIQDFAPHAILVISWDVGAYRRVSRAMAGRTLRVLCMDNQWLATPKQRAGVLISRQLIRPTYDVAFLPGERQAVFARRLGFGDDRILPGLYTCNHDSFLMPATETLSDRPPAFLFAGQLVHRKGADILAEAYRDYRSQVRDPWSLIVCGIGPMTPKFENLPGAELRGFVQPSDLPATFRDAACFVLPSRLEPWGVVIHEATTAGLTVICTTVCGASTRLVLDGYNGIVVPPNDVDSLTRALVEVSAADSPSLSTMGRRSIELSHQYTPERWAHYLRANIVRLRRELGIEGP